MICNTNNLLSQLQLVFTASCSLLFQLPGVKESPLAGGTIRERRSKEKGDRTKRQEQETEAGEEQGKEEAEKMRTADPGLPCADIICGGCPRLLGRWFFREGKLWSSHTIMVQPS